MKKILMLITLLAGTAILHAQDVIILRDSTVIEAKVLQINESAVIYKKWKNMEGPIYKKSVEKIRHIRYANGTEDVFDATKVAKLDSLQQISRPFIKDARFQSYFSAGYFDGSLSRGVEGMWSCGVRIFDYGYAGLQTGLRYAWKYGYEYWMIPMWVDLRGYYPINNLIHPYIEFSCGLEFRRYMSIGYDYPYYGPYYGYPGRNSRDWLQYFSYYVGAGFDISRFTMGVGYYRGFYSHNLHVKMGVKIGRQ